MTGIKLAIPLNFTDLTLPLLGNDPILSPGSLALYEIGHPGTGIAGVPAHNALVPNIAATEARVLMPGATDADLSATFKTAASEPTKINVERTGKGGLHVIVSKATPAAAGAAYAGLYGRDKIVQYVRDNVGHQFYVSYWGRETRSPISGNGGLAGLSFANSPSGTNLHHVLSHDGNNYPTSPSYRTGWAREANGAAGAGVMADTNTAWPPSLPADIRASVAVAGSASATDRTTASVVSGNFFKIFSFGNTSELFTQPITGPSSGIAYRYYLEDLTVSGRSFATVDALDKQLYTKHVRTPGGRYYGDTFTSPATIA
jgi:hypothetical protein